LLVHHSAGKFGYPRSEVPSMLRARPVAGHREMSLTTGPGDNFYPLISSHLTPKAAATVRSCR